MEFASGKAFTQHVQDYALAANKQVKVTTRGGNNRTVVYTSPHCSFFTTAYKGSSGANPSRPFCIVSLYIDCTSTAKPTARQIARRPSAVSAVRPDRQVPTSFVSSQVQAMHSINLSDRQRSVYRVKAFASEAMESEDNMTYKWLPSLPSKFVELNTGSVTKIEQSDGHRFQRCVVIFGSAVSAACGMQKILGIDGAHTKNKLYSGTQLVLICRDGNMNNVRIACALVPSESEEHCTWFLRACIETGVPPSVPVFSDKGSGLVATRRSLNILLKHCTLNIVQNILHKFPARFRRQHTDYIWDEHVALDTSLFLSQMELLEVAWGDAVRKYVSDVNPVSGQSTPMSARQSCTAAELPTSSKASAALN